MIESIHQVEYDNYGRMKYNPDLHDRQGTPWTHNELNYLIDWYDLIGVEEMSLALGRTEVSITHKVNVLRRQGRMSFPKKICKNKRLLSKEIIEATKDTRQNVQDSTQNNSQILYHMEGGMQIAN
jgi:hypothetical protein